MIVVLGGDDALVQRVRAAADGRSVTQVGTAEVLGSERPELVICYRAHWDPGWIPPSWRDGDGSVPVILCCPAEPADAVTTWFGGIDDWLPPTADEAAWRTRMRRLVVGDADSPPPAADPA